MEKHTLKLEIVITVLLLFGITSLGYAQGSMYQDNKATQVGDILTVVLQENIAGSTNSDAQNSTSSAAGGGGSVSGNFIPFEPTFGSDVEVNYNSDEQIQTNQGQLLEGYMSVEVKDMTSGGNLVVEGTRSTRINGEQHKINLTGVIRPRDINGRNEVLSFRIANAEIDYEKEGSDKSITKRKGFFRKAALAGVGIILGAAAILKSQN